MLLFKQCWEVNSKVLTFLEVRLGGNFVQGFRVYAWRTVPSFPKMALCALEIQSDPSPLGCFVPWELMLGSPLALSVLITFYAPLSGFCMNKTTRGRFKTISHRINLKILSCLNVFQTCCVTMPGLKVIYFFYRWNLCSKISPWEARRKNILFVFLEKVLNLWAEPPTPYI